MNENYKVLNVDNPEVRLFRIDQQKQDIKIFNKDSGFDDFCSSSQDENISFPNGNGSYISCKIEDAKIFYVKLIIGSHKTVYSVELQINRNSGLYLYKFLPFSENNNSKKHNEFGSCARISESDLPSIPLRKF